MCRVDWDNVDMVIGGTPCQPFSKAGKHKGTDDGKAYPFIARALLPMLNFSHICCTIQAMAATVAWLRLASSTKLFLHENVTVLNTSAA